MSGRWPRLRAAAMTGLKTQAVATVGLAPLSMLFFQQVSLVGYLANLVAIPVVTLLLTPLALAGALLPPLWAPAAGLVSALTTFLELLARWPLAMWTAAAVPAWVGAAGLLGGALLVLPLPGRMRLLGVPLLLPVLLPPPAPPAPGRFEVVVVDVGQGSAVLVRTRSHLLVYDTGPQYSSESDAGERVLLPLLRARGERRVDLLMLSHRDSDHVGGAASLLARFPVAAMSSSLDPAHPLRAAPLPHRPCLAGERWIWDGVGFEVLHPDAELLAVPVKRANALSCVLRVQDARGASALLTGDIEAAQEAALVVRDAARELPLLPSTVLLVPHHGSRTSSSAVFLDAVTPRLAAIQAAYRSRFGHPAPDVVARYDERTIGVRRSDRCGAWTWHGEGDGRCERDARRRYWHHGP
jgi:competence protein ComEC